MVNKGSHPQMAQQFRLVKYYNLPRYMFFFGILGSGQLNKWSIQQVDYHYHILLIYQIYG